MQIRRVFGLLIAFMLSTIVVNAATINMVDDDMKTEDDSDIDFALNISDFHYSVTTSDGIVQKIELDGNSTPEFTVNTDWDSVWRFVENYNQMSWLDKVRVLITEFKVPAKYILKMD